MPLYQTAVEAHQYLPPNNEDFIVRFIEEHGGIVRPRVGVPHMSKYQFWLELKTDKGDVTIAPGDYVVANHHGCVFRESQNVFENCYTRIE